MPYKDYEKQKAQTRAYYYEKTYGIPSPIKRPQLSLEEKIAKRKEYLRQYAQRPDIKDKKHDVALQRTYGITLNDKKDMYLVQEGLCGFCSKQLPEEIRLAHVDHNHTTGEVRKLLHKQCNYIVGVFENNPELLGVLSNYLKLDNKSSKGKKLPEKAKKKNK